MKKTYSDKYLRSPGGRASQVMAWGYTPHHQYQNKKTGEISATMYHKQYGDSSDVFYVPKNERKAYHMKEVGNEIEFSFPFDRRMKSIRMPKPR